MPSLLICLCLAPVGAAASQASILPQGAKRRGEAAFRFLGFQIYKARLFTQAGELQDWSQDFGLELTYQHQLSQSDLVEATMREMTRMGNALPIRDQLQKCYQPVGVGDTYLAVSDGPDHLTFWRNGVKACTLTQKDIKTHFMSIFLSDNSRSASFTRTLLGQ
ncbi:hypothetical protein RSK20926_21769 [Roseobacter sp. SK209-2-6]|uniref:hypothetical protein n=1 Tax=Roseobacter sp. SK209-2-6 TaxID=388739 RepID=UPI0000F3F2E5|nr:hypothetical protein [Roseobacter sp. SK209-2-6]EBA16397.1 hypothetical protein RSK20926_21769 [Roseobacter sp. SK209-2-6]